MREKMAGKINPRIIAAEPASCPSLTRGEYRYDFGDTAGMTPLMKMHTLGHDFIPDPIHAGGLRYHGMAPLVSQAVIQGFMRPAAVEQAACFEAAVLWARTEGFIPAPETSHAIAQVIREAKRATEEGKEKTIIFTYSGHGLLDLSSYEKYLSGKMIHCAHDETGMIASIAKLKGHPKP
jgi:tryptophan synthase beta chain